MKRCPTCNHEFPDEYRFCQNDRTPLEAAEETRPWHQQSVEAQVSKLKPQAAKALQQGRQWYQQKDVLGWVKGHALLLGAAGVGVVALFIVYYVFIKPKPDVDGNSSALVYRNCENSYKPKVDAVYQAFLNEFAGHSYSRRADAVNGLEQRLSQERRVYEKCIADAAMNYEKLARRYADDSEGYSEFSQAFLVAGSGPLAANDLEVSSQRFAAIDEKFRSILPPFPNSQRIIADLLGKRMDGWHFADAFEFKAVNTVNSKLDGDWLVMQTHLNLESLDTKAPYFSVVNVTYMLNSDGDWNYYDLTELLFNPPDVNYIIDNKIFLLGKWRWQSNSSLYEPDGSWSGKWDSGEEANGTWRIVNGNLVLTRKGNNWVNTKIMTFSKNELVVGEISQETAQRIQ